MLVVAVCGQATGWLAPIVLGYMTKYPVVGGEAGDIPLSAELDAAGAAENSAVTGLSREQWLAIKGTAPPQIWLSEMRAEWRTVFVMAAVIDICGLMTFLVWGKGERQWWDEKGKM